MNKIRKSRHTRLLFFSILFLVWGARILSQLYEVQVEQHEELQKETENRCTGRRKSEGTRGKICFANGGTLAGSILIADVYATPSHFRVPVEDAAAFLAKFFSVEEEVLLERFQRYQADKSLVECVVKRNVSLDKYNEFCLLTECPFPETGNVKWKKNKRNPYRRGIRGITSTLRHYPKGTLASNLVGITNSEKNGGDGLEYVLDAWLRPVTEEIVYKRDRRGRRLANKESKVRRKGRDGNNVYLTIQEPIQYVVENELKSMVKEFDADAGYAVMINPHTGEIMALANDFTFDPNDRRNLPPWGKRKLGALCNGFEPGSTMKPLSISAAVEYGCVRMDSTFFCENQNWRYSSKLFRDTHSYGDLTVAEILEHSSNIGAAKIALKMGPSKHYNILLRYGFNRTSELAIRDLPGWRMPVDSWRGWIEERGFLRSPGNWSKICNPQIATGYSIRVTPLQLALAYCALANGGTRMQPLLISKIINSQTNEITKIPPRSDGRVISAKTARQITQALKTVVSSGTGKKARVDGFRVAGKTGTAHKVKEGGKGYHSRQYFASFIGYVPADNPAFVLLVVCDNPKKNGHYGGTVAGPTFSRIAAATLDYLEIPATEETRE